MIFAWHIFWFNIILFRHLQVVWHFLLAPSAAQWYMWCPSDYSPYINNLCNFYFLKLSEFFLNCLNSEVSTRCGSLVILLGPWWIILIWIFVQLVKCCLLSLFFHIFFQDSWVNLPYHLAFLYFQSLYFCSTFECCDIPNHLFVL